MQLHSSFNFRKIKIEQVSLGKSKYYSAQMQNYIYAKKSFLQVVCYTTKVIFPTYYSQQETSIKPNGSSNDELLEQIRIKIYCF